VCVAAPVDPQATGITERDEKKEKERERERQREVSASIANVTEPANG